MISAVRGWRPRRGRLWTVCWHTRRENGLGHSTSGRDWPKGTGLDQFYLARPPFFREERLQRIVEVQDSEPVLVRIGKNPVAITDSDRLLVAKIDGRGDAHRTAWEEACDDLGRPRAEVFSSTCCKPTRTFNVPSERSTISAALQDLGAEVGDRRG
jgi:hypothetical protein